MEAFLRTEIMLGKERTERIRKSSVVVIGLGAVGSYCVEGLARAGVGHLILIDFDKVKPSNINRNLYALRSTVGRSKVSIARQRVLDINPGCTVEAHELFVASEVVQEIFERKPDLVVDAIDSLGPKTQLLAAVHSRRIPVIASMGAALRTDPFSITLGDISQTSGCPLARRLRRDLRKFGIENGIPCVFSDERVSGMPRREYLPEGEEYERGRKRQTIGSLPTIPGIFGLIIAHKAIDMLCGGMKIARKPTAGRCA